MKKKSKYNEDVEIDINACSATDFTGLIPSLPQSDAERESYEDLYHNYKNEAMDRNLNADCEKKCGCNDQWAAKCRCKNTGHSKTK